MGAEQSSTQDKHSSNDAGQPLKRCYYDVLGIDLQATEDEIKKAYRRKALELHPDRNYGDVDNATKQFAEVQSAYQVLSDPQERAWYDSHRDAILRNDDLGGEDHFEHNIKLTSAGDIIKLIGKFTTSTPFTDSPDGFFGILRHTFENIAKEEDAACEWEGIESIDYPDFGESQDNYEDVVKPFYTNWMGFSSKKTFAWKDAYNYAEAPDRRIRRLMEKENKRLREDGLREFNDAVRSLVAFVRKRDPRYTPNLQTEAERQKILRDAAAAQAARSRAAHQAKFDDHVIPSWSQTQGVDEEYFSESEQSAEEHFECVICGKLFKSEKQYDAHEKSKKHIKAVQQLKRQMQKENKLLNLDDEVMSRDSDTPLDKPEVKHSTADCKENLEPEDESQQGLSPRGGIPLDVDTGTHDATDKDLQPDTISRIAENSSESYSNHSESDLDDDYASREEVANRITNPAHELKAKIGTQNIHVHGPQLATALDAVNLVDDGDTTPSEPQQKMGKAKAKRAKRAARQETDMLAEEAFTCSSCKEGFKSKNQLFSHIKEEGHAQQLPKNTKSNQGKRRFQ